MKTALNVITDILTLIAICVAAIGHVLPWFSTNAQVGDLVEYQKWHSERSGIALGALAACICLSLLFNWGPGARRFLNLGMFASAFAALLFELLVFSSLVHPGDPPVKYRDTEVGFGLAMVPTCVAVFLSLLRMLWTMPARRAAAKLPMAAPFNEPPPGIRKF
jgi:hypothetical protein